MTNIVLLAKHSTSRRMFIWLARKRRDQWRKEWEKWSFKSSSPSQANTKLAS